ncbi:MAG: hypothetical protein IKZ50_02400 [Bacteroidales bacterium]|nr:hypothetical protein [Bacteroidales bacterium]
MKKYYIILTIGLLCLTACNKEDKISEEQNSDKITFIKAKNGDNDSKASVDNTSAAFTWNTGDKVAVYTTDGYKISNGLEATYDGTNAATFAFSDMVEAHRTDFALFPASLVWDGTNIRPNSASNHTSTGLTVTLPASYTLSEVQDEKSPVPMIATNAPNGDLNFKSLCALLRITVQNVPYMAKRLEFDFNGKKVQGEFTLTSVEPGTTGIETCATSENDDIITVTMADNHTWHDAMVINLPVPAGVATTGEYTDITISAYDATSGGNRILYTTRPIKSTANWIPGRKASRKITAILPVFSVSATKKVAIASSNLQASTSDCGATWTWHFATNPWNYNGDNSVKTDDKYYHNERVSGDGTVKFSGFGTVDQFGWVGASNTAWSGVLGSTGNAAMHGISWSNDNSDYGNVSGESLKSDWGNTINDGYAWRTPTSAEWVYLIGSRPSGSTVNGTSNARYVLARINTDVSAVNGMIIFPDGITIANDEATRWGIINKELGSSWTITWDANATLFTSSQWTALAAKGCVFLPMAGAYRYRSGSNTPVFQPGTAGAYWSSSSNGTATAYHLEISKSYVDPSYGALSTSDRNHGHSVRLVRDLN